MTTTTRRHARRGITLTEVLVAMFVMALGMLALLTLFPLGAMQMGGALRDDRSAQIAAQADVYMRQYWRVHYLERLAVGQDPTDDFGWGMDDPNLLWRGAHFDPFQNYYVDRYVSASSFPQGRLLPGGVNLGLPNLAPVPPYPSTFPPLPNPLPGLTRDVQFVPPPQTNPAVPPFYYQPPLPTDGPLVGMRYSTIGQRAGGLVPDPTDNVPKPIPSYAVLIDPLGYANRSGTAQVWAAGFPGQAGPPVPSTTELLPAPNGSPFQYPLRLPRRTVGLDPGATPTNPGRIHIHNLQLAMGGGVARPLQYFPGSAVWPTNPPVNPNPDPRLYDPRRAFQTCALTDDHTFEANGAPGATVIRQGRYTWAAVVQRPRNDDPTTASLTILVFDGRSPSLAVPGDEAMAYPDANIAPGARQIQLSLPARTPDQSVLLRRGGWIMDGTIVLDPNPANSLRKNKFYRVTGVTEVGPSPTVSGGVQYVIDIDPPFQGVAPVFTPPGGGAAVPLTQLYVFAGLTAVFERPALGPDQKYQP